MEYVLYEKQDQIGILTLNRPKALNALNSAVVAELTGLLDEIAASDIRCLIVTGAGEKAFVAGADIAEMKDFGQSEAEKFSAEGNVVMEKLESLPMPTIAAVNGFALGGGCELALSCDIRIASENAVFGLPEVSLGIPPGYGGIQRLVRIVGVAKAKEMLFTTNKIKAAKALSLGLVNAVSPPEELMDTCKAMAEKIASMAPLAIRAVKNVANASIGLTLEDATRLEVRDFGRCFGTHDQKTAMTAFVEKTKPEPFTGN